MLPELPAHYPLPPGQNPPRDRSAYLHAIEEGALELPEEPRQAWQITQAMRPRLRWLEALVREGDLREARTQAQEMDLGAVCRELIPLGWCALVRAAGTQRPAFALEAYGEATRAIQRDLAGSPQRQLLAWVVLADALEGAALHAEAEAVWSHARALLPRFEAAGLGWGWVEEVDYAALLQPDRALELLQPLLREGCEPPPAAPDSAPAPTAEAPAGDASSWLAALDEDDEPLWSGLAAWEARDPEGLRSQVIPALEARLNVKPVNKRLRCDQAGAVHAALRVTWHRLGEREASEAHRDQAFKQLQKIPKKAHWRDDVLLALGLRLIQAELWEDVLRLVVMLARRHHHSRADALCAALAPCYAAAQDHRGAGILLGFIERRQLRVETGVACWIASCCPQSQP